MVFVHNQATVKQIWDGFEMPKNNYNNRKEAAQKKAQKKAPKGWLASTYFGSQDSFFVEDGKDYASTTMSRWVEKDVEGAE